MTEDSAQSPDSRRPGAVPARVSLVTLGSSDVARATTFYTALGWELSSASVAGDVSFFRTAGALLSIYGAAELAADARQEPPSRGRFSGVALAINVATPGEVALVDREGRIGPLGTVFYDTLLDENAASHIALGSAYAITIDDEADKARANQSAIHVDFMIGGDDVAVTGVAGDGTETPVLRGGAWQL